jgi:hypothetical protein
MQATLRLTNKQYARAAGTAVLLLSACGRPDLPVQRISLQSGDFGIAELATVVAVDPIVLRDNLVRFNIAFGEFAVSILGETAPSATDIWAETTRAFGAAVTEELEDYIRGLSCVYTVKPEGTFISGAVAETVRFSGGDDELGVVIEGSGVPFDDAGSSDGGGTGSTRGNITVTDGGQSLPTEDTKDLEVSVVSNCLIGVHPDSSVRIVQTPERMMILPQPVSSLFGKRAVSGTKKGQP